MFVMEVTIAQGGEAVFGSVLLSADAHRTMDKPLLIYEHMSWVGVEKEGFPSLNRRAWPWVLC